MFGNTTIFSNRKNATLQCLQFRNNATISQPCHKPNHHHALQSTFHTTVYPVSFGQSATTSKPTSSRGGALAIFYREKSRIAPVKDPACHSFEATVCQLSGPIPTIVATLYHPPKPNKDFITDFAGFLMHLSTLSPNIIILWDFNIHMDNASNIHILLGQLWSAALHQLSHTY